jgi:hypothetical protein
LTLAQTPARTSGSQNPPAAGQETVRPTVTLVGCLYREDQVPGRKPNIAERAGILEDYILAGASEPGGASGTSGATGTSGTNAEPVTGNMYKIDGPSDEQLKSLVGKRVSVVGRIDPEGRAGNVTGGPQPDRGLGPDTISLPDIKASSISAASGTCPATPAPLK